MGLAAAWLAAQPSIIEQAARIGMTPEGYANAVMDDVAQMGRHESGEGVGPESRDLGRSGDTEPSSDYELMARVDELERGQAKLGREVRVARADAQDALLG